MGTRRRRVSVIYFISKLVKWDDLGMEIISNPKQVEIKKAAQALKNGHLVAFPTETVYGLGADATNEKAVSRIYSVKGRPTNHPLIVHISSIKHLNNWASEIPDYAVKLANEFWPGPMTLILKKTELAQNYITGGQGNIGLRVPANEIALALLTEFEKLNGYGIAAPSANKFGATSPTSAEDVRKDIGNNLNENDVIISGQSCEIGIESTIIDCLSKQPKIIRPGFITSERIAKLTNLKIDTSSFLVKIKHSGQHNSHYAPNAKIVVLGESQFGDGFLALSKIPTPKNSIRLASPENTEEFARVLYSAYRKADELSLSRILVIPPQGGDFAVAVRDRITKSSMELE
jgi:L-threonylcarbamoyladenylate synthase